MEAIILAAGKGTRMSTKVPLVLHRLAEMPLISHAIHALLENAAFTQITVVVSSSDRDATAEVVTAEFPDTTFNFVLQPDTEERRDCISATAAGLQGIKSGPNALVAVLPANIPLLRPVIRNLLHCAPASLDSMPSGEGLGRSQSAQSPAAAPVKPPGTVPANGAPGSEQPPERVYSKHFASHFKSAWQPNHSGAACCSDGPILIARSSFLSHRVQEALMNADRTHLDTLLRDYSKADPSNCLVLSSAQHLLRPVTTRRLLAATEQDLKSQKMAELGEEGVTFRDPLGTYIGPLVRIGMDSVIGVGVQLYGKTRIGCNVRVDGPTVLNNAIIGDGCHIRAFTTIEDAVMEAEANAGPYARLRVGTRLESHSYVGNFVETKNVHLSQNSLACHLTYLGDAHVGPRSNIGAGTITCNFDGAGKNSTRIGSGAFVGSNTTLVAPVHVGDDTLIAAGSVITQDVAPGAAAFGRARQSTREGSAAAIRQKANARHGPQQVPAADAAQQNGELSASNSIVITPQDDEASE
ncbi:hypothetical protein WJX73_010852 [Symbiochloris irregularis]|uniref:MobA-like NTP transferase domain-containing protein n=1 Tax=Symbiochloris irregularis TaxID=706552 RepID=A0AAW1PUD5_9CHLO